MPEVPETSTPTWPPRVRFLRIGEVVIDLALRRVSHGDHATELPQRVFDVLLVLAAEPHVLHTRQALLARVWAGVIVEDANLSQSVSVLRKALGEPHKAWIRTRSKQGYVFEPPFDIEALDALEAPGAPDAGVAAEDGTAARDAATPVAATAPAPRR
ncbi:winged helix-turn-helix domain-containing protein, partial [Marilutibacter aestuarii]